MADVESRIFTSNEVHDGKTNPLGFVLTSKRSREVPLKSSTSPSREGHILAGNPFFLRVAEGS